ncbi:hypothetical protein MetMK1DRAFT_00000890 [Metallosphaera yellowstonensis MK1]|uniref:Uncharacterized protein n=1 Tax=Metallosphaera yellowstonensis MK1 TaxID=671065 RepID=H2C0L8_9CREN|nr:hypothetical protein MetMK1DRAFT_00000890 [Metallosphaera yellowstonensis MK1]
MISEFAIVIRFSSTAGGWAKSQTPTGYFSRQLMELLRTWIILIYYYFIVYVCEATGQR